MRTDEVRFRFNGREATGQSSDTIATALLRSGVQVFDRSLKRRRTRGPSCLEGFCMSCLLEVNGEPDVVTCRTPLREGMDVKSQIASPILTFDVRALILNNVLEVFGKAPLDRWFTRPAWVREQWLRLQSRISGRGRLDLEKPPPSPLPFETLSTQVLVVGGGISGMASAHEISAAGLQALLIDRGRELGGWWARWRKLGELPVTMDPLRSSPPALPSDVRLLLETTVLGLYEDRTALAIGPETAFRICFESVIIATGCYPRIIAFPGSDQPMNLPVQGIIRAAVETGWTPASVVLMDIDNLGGDWRNVLQSLGVEVRLLPLKGSQTILDGIQASRAAQSCCVQLALGETLRGEAVCWSAGWRPREELIRQFGGKVVFAPDKGALVPILRDDVFVGKDMLAAGGCAGVSGFASSQLHGQLAGAALVSRLDPAAGKKRFDALARQWSESIVGTSGVLHEEKRDTGARCG